MPLKLKPHLSNRRNFRLDFASIGLPSSQPIVLDVGKSVQIPLTFVPSKINCVVDCVVQFCCDEVSLLCMMSECPQVFVCVCYILSAEREESDYIVLFGLYAHVIQKKGCNSRPPHILEVDITNMNAG